MLIKLAFGCVYTSPRCSATMSGVSFFFRIAKQLWKSTNQFFCSKPHYARKRKINNSKDKTIPSAFNHHDERKCTFFVIRAVQSLQVLWYVDGGRLLGQFTWSVLILLSVISCKHFPKHLLCLTMFTRIPAYFHLVGVTAVKSKTCIIWGWWPDTDIPSWIQPHKWKALLFVWGTVSWAHSHHQWKPWELNPSILSETD